MTDTAARAALIAALADKTAPVRRVHPAEGSALIALATLAAALAMIALFDFWHGIASGQASPFFWITNGLLLLLGAASTMALVVGALPRVGARPNAPGWTLAMLGVLPLAAIIRIAKAPDIHAHSGLTDPYGWHCVSSALVAALVVGAAAVLFMRRGAPVAIVRQAWLTGLTAGSLGSLAFGMTCPLDGIAHLGIWHVAPVPLAALTARLIVPPLIRW
jgi:hypothetical protein